VATSRFSVKIQELFEASITFGCLKYVRDEFSPAFIHFQSRSAFNNAFEAVIARLTLDFIALSEIALRRAASLME
jgi:hypothetical protein